jgi:hypothetical protein
VKFPGPFKIRKIAVKDHGCHYETFLVEGYLQGSRIRRKFQRREEAIGEKARLEIEAGNAKAAMRVVPTRLNEAQIAEAEFCFRRLGDRSSLSEVLPLIEPVRVLVFRWWTVFRTAIAWLSGRILPEADGQESHAVARYCSRDARTQVFP